MFGDQPEKIPDAEAAEQIFGDREKGKLEEVYKSETGPDGEPLAHKAAKDFCDQNGENEYEIPSGSSPGETAGVIGYMISQRTDLMPNVLDESIKDGQKKLAYIYFGKCAMENGDH
ncbi:MAG: hypothetical protein ABEJ95_07890 [Candidatus Nanohalobium sp.]